MRWHACIYEHVYAREETHTHTVITFKSQFLELCYGSLNSHQGGLGDEVNNQLGVVPPGVDSDLVQIPVIHVTKEVP